MLTTIAKLNLASDVTWLEVSSHTVIVTAHTVSSHTVTLVALRSSVAASRGRHSAGCPLRLCFRGSLSGRFGARCLRGRCYRVVFRQLWCQASWFFPTDVLRCIRLPRVFRARPIAPHCPLALTAHRTYFHKSGAAGGPNSAARLAGPRCRPRPWRRWRYLLGPQYGFAPGGPPTCFDRYGNFRSACFKILVHLSQPSPRWGPAATAPPRCHPLRALRWGFGLYGRTSPRHSRRAHSGPSCHFGERAPRISASALPPLSKSWHDPIGV